MQGSPALITPLYASWPNQRHLQPMPNACVVRYQASTDRITRERASPFDLADPPHSTEMQSCSLKPSRVYFEVREVNPREPNRMGVPQPNKGGEHALEPPSPATPG